MQRARRRSRGGRPAPRPPRRACAPGSRRVRAGERSRRRARAAARRAAACRGRSSRFAPRKRMKNRARWYEVGMPPSDLTWEGLRELAVFRAENGCAISLYVSLDPSEVPTAGDIAARINALLSNGEHDLGQRRELVQEQRSGLRADFARLRDYFANDFDRAGAHGAAVFLAGLDNVFRPLLLSEAVPDT